MRSIAARKHLLRLVLAMVLQAAIVQNAHSQQVADLSFSPPIHMRAYIEGEGPVVLIDEAHHNYHTASDRYRPFADLISRDGYRAEASKSRITLEELKRAQIFVIANALHEVNAVDWSPPNPSAFADEEISVLRRWVEEGGSLLLIADHQPFAGAAQQLAAAFGITFSNGDAVEPAMLGEPLVFDVETGGLLKHDITRGRNAGERVSAVTTFKGSAFMAGQCDPLLRFSDMAIAFQPQDASQEFTDQTHRTPIGGSLQGATCRVGEGRVAVFGEAAMFTAQLAGPEREPVGMNAPTASQNAQFLLNVLHWLSGLP